MSSVLIYTMTSSYVNEMHDVVCVNYTTQKVNFKNPQKTGVTGALSTTPLEGEN